MFILQLHFSASIVCTDGHYLH